MILRFRDLDVRLIIVWNDNVYYNNMRIKVIILEGYFKE